MNRFERAVAQYLEQNGPLTAHEILSGLRHKYFIGSVKSIATKMHASPYFRKVDKERLTGDNGSYTVAVWEVKKHE